MTKENTKAPLKTIWQIIFMPYRPYRNTFIAIIAAFGLGVLWGSQLPRSENQSLLDYWISFLISVGLFSLIFIIGAIYWRFFSRPQTQSNRVTSMPSRKQKSRKNSDAYLPITSDLETYNQALPIAHIQTVYTHTPGKHYDEAFAVNHTDTDQYFGELGISAVYDPYSPDEAVALEIWLFDALQLSEVITAYFITDEVLVMPQTRAGLDRKGTLVRIVSTDTLTLETETLHLKAKILTCHYRHQRNTFQQVKLDVLVWENISQSELPD